MIENASDQELMGLLAEGDLVAWSEIVKRHTRLVFLISNQILKNTSDAEDSVKNTFIKIKMYAKNFDPSMPLRPWLSRIASGEAVRIYKKKKAFQKESTRVQAKEFSLDSKKYEVSNKLEKEELGTMIKSAISRLPDLPRLAITLRYVGGMNEKEIAKELGVSQFSVSEKINYGLDRNKSGLFTSVVLSPFLLQGSLLSEASPVELIEKIVKVLPSHAQRPQEKPSILSFTYKPVLGMKMKFISIFFVFSLVGFAADFYLFQNSSESRIPAVDIRIVLKDIKGVNIKKTVNKNNFFPVSFDDYIPVTCKFAPYKSSSAESGLSGEVPIVDSKRKWTIFKKKGEQEAVFRDNNTVDDLDGLYLDQEFDMPYMFTGKINFNEKSDFLFVLSSGLKGNVEASLANNNGENGMMPWHLSTMSRFQAGKGNEVHFLIYIWSHKNKLMSAVFLLNRGIPETGLIIRSTQYYNANFKFGFLSNGRNEVSEFKACSLGHDWDFEKDENIKPFLKDFPQNYFE